jgi:hypothetical protein
MFHQPSLSSATFRDTGAGFGLIANKQKSGRKARFRIF